MPVGGRECLYFFGPVFFGLDFQQCFLPGKGDDQHRRNCFAGARSGLLYQSYYSEDDKIYGHNVIEQLGHKQNQNTGHDSHRTSCTSMCNVIVRLPL